MDIKQTQSLPLIKEIISQNFKSYFDPLERMMNFHVYNGNHGPRYVKLLVHEGSSGGSTHFDTNYVCSGSFGLGAKHKSNPDLSFVCLGWANLAG
jgi:hypothetical protein